MYRCHYFIVRDSELQLDLRYDVNISESGRIKYSNSNAVVMLNYCFFFLFRKLLDFMLDNLAISTTPPPSRPWLQLAPLDRTAPTALFTVMCYNVLCDRYATRCVLPFFLFCLFSR
jgi:hypothetical protein